MVQGSDILNYTGNVGLGLNTDGVVNYGETDTRDITNSLTNLAYLNMQKNREVWRQKILDRDDAMSKIANGQLALKNALPKDRKALMGKIEQVKDFWFQHGGDVKSDPNVYLQFNEILADLQAANTIAGSRLLEYEKGMQEAARETHPVRKKKILEHWQTQADSLDIYTPFQPYQQTLDWEAAKVLPQLPMGEAKVARDGDYDVTSASTDMEKAFTQYMNAYNYDEKGEMAPNVDSFYEDYLGRSGLKPKNVVLQEVDLVNKKLRKIAEMNGYNPDDVSSLPEYLQPLQLADDVNGTLQSTINKPATAFKVALALNYQKSTSRKLNEDYAKIDKTRAEIGRIEEQNKLTQAQAEKAKKDAESNRIKALAQRGYYAARTTQINLGNQAASSTTQADNPYNSVITQVQTPKNGGPMYIADSLLTPSVKQMMGGVGRDKKPIPLQPKKMNIDGKEVSGYEFRPVDEWYFKDKAGKWYSYSKEELAKDAKQRGIKLSEYIKKFVDAGAFQDGEVIGKNGKGTRLSTFQAAKALNNPLVNKGDQSVMTDEENSNEDNEE